VQVFGRVARRAARSSGDGSQRRGRAKNRDVAPLGSKRGWEALWEALRSSRQNARRQIAGV